MRHPELIVFDLDDTLLDTSDVYWSARTRFVNEMGALGLPRDYVVELFEEVDARLMQEVFHAPQRYGMAMLAAYKELAEDLGVPLSSETQGRIFGHGRVVIERMPEALTGARELLRWAYDKYDLALLTRGETELQLKKIKAAEIEQFFGVIRVVGRKDAAAFAEVIAEQGHTPASTWIIGDSLSSEIGPGLEIGARCVLYEYWHHSYEWRQRHEVTVEGPFIRVSSLTDVPQVLCGGSLGGEREYPSSGRNAGK